MKLGHLLPLVLLFIVYTSFLSVFEKREISKYHGFASVNNFKFINAFISWVISAAFYGGF